ncbi:MAG: YceD family protein [Bacteroidales bacterium]
MTCLYVIPLFGLGEGHHIFDFKIGNQFFDGFAESEIKEGELVAVAGIDRGPSCIDLTIKITGNVKVCCDRCLDMYLQPIECENHIVIKPGKYMDDSDPDILVVPPDEKELDLSQLLYEYIHLALPLRRVHPDTNEGKCGCNPDMIKELNKHIINNNGSGNFIWAELKKLLNKN